MKIPGYAEVFILGHAALGELFFDPVIVEEKIDGSQYSFGLIDGEYTCRSKGKDQTPPLTDGMFDLAVANTKDLPLREGWVYRGEFLGKPKHNALCYGRIPQRNVVIFDINPSLESYLSPEEKQAEAARLGLEAVPLLAHATVGDWSILKGYLDHESFLGGSKIEGFVIKNYLRFGKDKKALMGKYVSEAFKEVHSHEWKMANPGGQDIIQGLILQLRTEARWNKAIQHLRDQGELQSAPRDIGPLLKEINQDVLKEETERIKDVLFRWAWGKVSRGIVAGFPEWYKERLAEQSFGQCAVCENGDII